MPKAKIQEEKSNEELRAIGTGENKFNRKKALELLPQCKEIEKKKIEKGWKWVRIHKGRKLVNPN